MNAEVPVLFAGLFAGGQRGLGLDARLHAEFTSKHLSSPRQVIVWLPPGYATDKGTRYPVLHMHDGQNVYIEWRIDDIAVHRQGTSNPPRCGEHGTRRGVIRRDCVVAPRAEVSGRVRQARGHVAFGMVGPQSGYPRDAKELRDTLRGKGWTLDSDLKYYELPKGTHDEESFARRAGDMLQFLFPAK